MNNNYNFLIVGDQKSGKSTLLNRIKSGSFVNDHTPTMNQSIVELKFNTNRGNVTMNFMELNEPNMYDVPKSFYPIDGAILVFDSTNEANAVLESVKMWHRVLRVVYLNEHTNNISVCGNKSDLVKPTNEWSNMVRGLVIDRLLCKYFNVSAKSNYNFEKPYLWLLRGLLGNDVEFVEY